MSIEARPCHRCGRKHVRGWIWLELDSWTNLFHRPGDVPSLPASRSQGLFPFGRDCAIKQLRATITAQRRDRLQMMEASCVATTTR